MTSTVKIVIKIYLNNQFLNSNGTKSKTFLTTNFQDQSYRLSPYEKDTLIAELRLQIYDLRKNSPDFQGVNAEMFNVEGRVRALQDEKSRADYDGRVQLDQASGDQNDYRKQLDELKFLVSEK